MSFTYFCPRCNQKMEVPDEMENTFYPCPYCKVNCLLVKQVDDRASRKTQKIFDEPIENETKPTEIKEAKLKSSLSRPDYCTPRYNLTECQDYPAQDPGCKSKKKRERVIYVLLGIFCGGFGAHNFYAGENQKGIAKIVLIITGMILFPLFAVFGGIVGIWALVEVCTVDKDANGVPFE